jgi:hypothetical protein
MKDTQKLNIFIGVDFQQVYANDLKLNNDKNFLKFLIHHIENTDYTHKIMVVDMDSKHTRIPVHDGSILPELEKVLKGNYTKITKDDNSQVSFNVISVIMQAVSKARSNSKDEIPVIDKINICGLYTPKGVLANAMLIRAFFPTANINVISNACKSFSDNAHHWALNILRVHNIQTITI